MVPKILNRLKLIELTPNFGQYTIACSAVRAKRGEQLFFFLWLSAAEAGEMRYCCEVARSELELDSSSESSS